MRILMASAYKYWGSFNPRDLFENNARDIQIGGGETAMIHIATELARRNHQVTVFYDLDRPGRYYGVDYLPTNLTIPMICQYDHDVLVSWDVAHLFRFADRAKVRVLAHQLNDPFVGAFDWGIDLYVHPSQWHADRMLAEWPHINPEKVAVRLTNGVDYSRYIGQKVTRVPKRVIYSSSPDRGLHHLLRIWPRIIAREPEATLNVFYDIQKWLKLTYDLQMQGIGTITTERANILRQQLQHLPPSVTMHGGIGQRRLAIEQLKSSVMAYPCDPVRPTEGFSMTILEGIASGCKVVTTNADAFPELWKDVPSVTMLDLPIDDDQWVNAIIDAMNAPADGAVYNEVFAWPRLAEAWERELYRCLQSNQKQSA